MMNKTYSTTQLARIAGVHPNTIRFYENAGFLSPAPRGSNGYRQFSDRHIVQLKVCRLIFQSNWMHRRLRNAAFAILEELRAWNLDMARLRAEEYLRMIEGEYARALETAAILRRWQDVGADGADCRYNQAEAAALIGVSMEVLRNWERNGLIAVPREGACRKRVYGEAEITRLRIIYMLRQSNYSIAAILRSFALRDSGNPEGAVLALNRPEKDDDISYISVGDRWLEVLGIAAEYAKQMIGIIDEASRQSYAEG